jgi:hypothetical protein
LRARAVPFGVVGYLGGQVVRIPLSTVMQGLILLVLRPLLLAQGITDSGLTAAGALKRRLHGHVRLRPELGAWRRGPLLRPGQLPAQQVGEGERAGGLIILAQQI